MALTAILYGLTLKYDYWSNSVELLAASLVCASGVMGWSPLWGLVCGLVLGGGRETTAILGLVGSGYAAAYAVGALGTHIAIRGLSETAPQWKEDDSAMQYGRPMWRTNLQLLRESPPALIDIAIYLAVAALAFTVSPWLTAALVGLTLYTARIDEPRVLTMLIPFAAMGALGQ